MTTTPLASPLTPATVLLHDADPAAFHGDNAGRGCPRCGADLSLAVRAWLDTPEMEAMLWDDVQRRQALEIRGLIGDDEAARMWLIRTHPALDQVPLSAIAYGHGAAAIAAAKEVA